MTAERTCVCCGFTSTNPHLFKRAVTEAPAWRATTPDEWICRSYWKCAERPSGPVLIDFPEQEEDA